MALAVLGGLLLAASLLLMVPAIVLLVQIAAGTIMAHAYYDRRSFYGIPLHEILPFNFLRDVHIQSPIVWIGVSWIGAGLFLGPAIAGGREARGQGFLVDVLFWVTVGIVAGALIGNWLGIMTVAMLISFRQSMRAEPR